MITSITYKGKSFIIDLSKPLDISIPLKAGQENVQAWYVDPVRIEPVKTDNFIGDVKQGGSVNFRNIAFNPHGNGTHTECVGHISKEEYSINQCLHQFFFLAEVISIEPEQYKTDKLITLEQVSSSIKFSGTEALLIRTLPNTENKITRRYSGTNPPYLHHDAVKFITSRGIDHLLVDLPSVDREMDEGKLLAHHSFWEYPLNPQLHRTITELIYIPGTIEDGLYILNLQIASFENDATPSKPVLFKIIE